MGSTSERGVTRGVRGGLDDDGTRAGGSVALCNIAGTTAKTLHTPCTDIKNNTSTNTIDTQ
jgi:hypothetical protein